MQPQPVVSPSSLVRSQAGAVREPRASWLQAVDLCPRHKASEDVWKFPRSDTQACGAAHTPGSHDLATWRLGDLAWGKRGSFQTFLARTWESGRDVCAPDSCRHRACPRQPLGADLLHDHLHPGWALGRAS